jgi:hypothetical protein
MAAIAQKGTLVIVGFAGHTYAGLSMEQVSKEQTGTQKTILDQNNEPVTILISDLGRRYTVRGIVLAADWVEPEVGDTITLNSVAARVESISTEEAGEESRVSMTVISEDSMAASY